MKTQKNKLFLGIDTSNYTTSVAIVDDDKNIVADCRKILNVKQGKRGLRQQEAVFLHIKNIYDLFSSAMYKIDNTDIAAISASVSPRDVKGSYMPVFQVGCTAAKTTALTLNIPFFETSHQMGHIYAVKEFVNNRNKNHFYFFHLSGGTCEICLADHGNIEIIGKSRDISYGQLIDRIGVYLGLSFPCGKAMDQTAVEIYNKNDKKLDIIKDIKSISISGFDINLSGIETALKRNLSSDSEHELNRKQIIYTLFYKISESLREIIEKIISTDVNANILIGGGVSQSLFIRSFLSDHLSVTAFRNIFFSDYGTDNAVGTALIAREKFHNLL